MGKFATFLASATLLPGIAQTPAAAADSATVPMRLELDRPYVDLTFTGPSGTPVLARVWLDTGGGALLLSNSLADRLGLKSTATPQTEEGTRIAPAVMPAVALGDMTLEPKGVEAAIAMDEPEHLMHTDAEAAVPVRMLRDYQVVFDYPAHTFTVAKALAPRGETIKTFIGPSGMPVIDVGIDGQTKQFLLDTGGTYTMISQTTQDELAKAHGDWPYASPAFGAANMLAGDTRSHMLMLGAITLGTSRIEDVGTVSRPAAVYEKWMANITGAPIVGSIGGNVLAAFRVEIDYPKGEVHLARTGAAAPSHMDTVAITLGAAEDGFVVAAVGAGAGDLAVGDVIVSIGGLDAAKATLAQMIEALAGQVGEKKSITVRRGGKILTVIVPVTRVL